MPPSGWRKPPPRAGLTGHVALDVLTQTVPSTPADAMMAPTGRHERRRRLLPVRVMVYGGLARYPLCDTLEREAPVPDVYQNSFLRRMNLTATPDA